MDVQFFFQLSKINFLHRFEKKVLDFCHFCIKKRQIVNPIRIYYRNPYQNPKWTKIHNFFFQIDVENLFLRVGKKIGDPYRSENLCSFHFWMFQGVWDTGNTIFGFLKKMSLFVVLFDIYPTIWLQTS